jgi:hypothetical protein
MPNLACVAWFAYPVDGSFAVVDAVNPGKPLGLEHK